MIPRDSQLVRTAHSAILQAINAPETVDIPTALESVRVVLNELLLRENDAFFVSYYDDGYRLAEEAIAFLKATPVAKAQPPALPAKFAYSGDDRPLAAANLELTRVNDRLTDILSRTPGPEASRLLEKFVSWELKLHGYRMQIAESRVKGGDTTMSKLNAESFEPYLRKKKPEWKNVRVKSFRRQPGGFSKFTCLVDLHDDVNGDHSVVIRAEPPRFMLDLEGMEITKEYPVLRFAYEAGLPVPEPLLLEDDPSHLGMRFVLARKSKGSVKGSVKGSDQKIPESALKDVIALMARIANTPVPRDNPLIQASHLKRWVAHKTLPENTRDFMGYWRQVGIDGNAPPSPLVTRGYNWLFDNVPEEMAPPVFIHGDVGFHNILFDGDKIMALLDWENSRVGDPAEELTLFISGTANQASREQILEWYREAGGPEISEYRLRYFDVYQAMKLIVSAQTCLQRVEEQAESSIHLAVFGLQYLYYIGQKLNDLIKVAEDAKARAGRR